jgi:chaperonin GroEL
MVIKQAAQATGEEAGDGTTTSTILARSIVKQATKHLLADSPPVELKRGMDKAVKILLERLDEASVSVSSLDDIRHIATISANGDTVLGNLIAEAIDKVGKDGAISIEPANSNETSLDLIEGFQFDAGYISDKFVTDKRRWAMRYENPLILVADSVVSSVEDIFPILQVAARENRPLIIVAEDVKDQALAAIIMNVVRGSMRVAAIRAPGYGEERRAILEDLALSVGATVVGPAGGVTFTNAKLPHLGASKVVESKKNWTAFSGGEGDPDQIEEKIEQIKAEIEQTDSLKECETLQRRINRLASGVAVLKIGGSTEIEMMEVFHRAEDALEAVRSAQKEGIISGGGVALMEAMQSLGDDGVHTAEGDVELAGAKIILDACQEPIRQMATNAGHSPDIISAMVRDAKTGVGFDFARGELANMLELGIIDPVKVTKIALTNAVSAAGTLITTSHGIVEVE